MKMMMLVGDMGKTQAKLKAAGGKDAALQAEVGNAMKELAAVKARITELERGG